MSVNVCFTSAYCINDEVTANDLEQLLHGYPNIMRVAAISARLSDDFGTSSVSYRI